MLTLPVGCWHVDVFITVPHFVVWPLWAANAIDLKDVLFCFEFSNFNVNFLPFKSVVNLLFGLSQKFLAQLLCFELFFLEGKIKFSEGLIGDNVDCLAVFHDSCDEKFVVWELVDLCEVKFDFFWQLCESQGVDFASIILNFHLGWFWFRFCGWHTFSIGAICFLLDGWVGGSHLIHSVKNVIIRVWVNIHFGTGCFFGFGVLRVDFFTLILDKWVPFDTWKRRHPRARCR